jgi:ribosome biogenesis protein MAK21
MKLKPIEGKPPQLIVKATTSTHAPSKMIQDKRKSNSKLPRERKRKQDEPLKASSRKPKRMAADYQSAEFDVQPHGSVASGLLNEIKALGGDERDLELVGDIESEFDGEHSSHQEELDSNLQADLQHLAAQLGLKSERIATISEGSTPLRETATLSPVTKQPVDSHKEPERLPQGLFVS